MKKLGTPIGAAPGRANENVGFEAVGVPPLLRSVGGLVGVAAGFLPLVLPFPLPVCPLPECLPALPLLCVEGFCVLLGPVGRGGDACFWVVVWGLLGALVVVVVVVVEVVVGGEGVAGAGGAGVVGGGGAGVDEVVDEVVESWQVTPGIWTPERLTHDGNAPEALGIAARPMTTTAAPAAATGILSFLRLITVV